ncbi:hypothetical protein ACLMJK_000015 [Lecanora helva]
MPAGPIPTILEGPNLVSPNVYVVFESIKASDGCNQIGPTFDKLTTGFPPELLSTVAPDGSTQSFNFADLPCPPASINWDPTKPYNPILAPPQYIFDLDPAFSTCIPGAFQGIDPPRPVVSAAGVSPPRLAKRRLADSPEPVVTANRAPSLRQGRRALAHAHPHAQVAPWAPRKTA